MAKKPDSRKGKDPARPTRSKAAREPLAPLAPHLEKLLNPGIAAGNAGVGSQTGLNPQEKPKPRSGKLPGAGVKEADPQTGLRPPAASSWERREDFSAAHRARGPGGLGGGAAREEGCGERGGGAFHDAAARCCHMTQDVLHGAHSSLA